MPRRVFPNRLLHAIGACTLLAFSDAASADPLAAVNSLRRQGCGSSAAPLTHVAALDTAARRVADGANLRAAMQASGYRAHNAALLSLEGVRSDDELSRALAQSCNPIAQASLREAGVYRRGGSLWLVFAEPFSPPALDAPKTGARVLDLVNRARAEPRRCGTQDFHATTPLRWSARLQAAALAHARDMAAHGAMSHAGSDGSTSSQRVTRAGYAWSATGENIAAGQRDADSVVKSWLASPGHCANLMSPDFTEMAVAFATNAGTDAGIYWTQVFGAPMDRSGATARTQRR